MLLRQPRVLVRSQTVNYGTVSSAGPRDLRSVVTMTPTPLNYLLSLLRRKSLVNLQKGHTGEGGSFRFRAALRKDSVHELHPGWNSIRKLGRVVG